MSHRLSKRILPLVGICMIAVLFAIAACAPVAAPPAAQPSAPVAQPTSAPAAEPTTAPAAAPTTSTGPTQAASTNAGGKSITVCLFADISTLDVRTLTILNVRTLANNIMDYPIQMKGSSLTHTPYLVTSWENIDPLTWRVKLREGVTFHNEEPFNAEAFKFSIETQRDSKAGVRSYAAAIKDVKIIDDYTVDLITEKPNVMTIPNLTGLYIFPPKYTTEVGEKFSDHPIGTGPFKFVEWVKGDHITLEANENYWNKELWPDGKPPVDQVIFRICPDVSTRVAMLQRGEADLIDNVPPERVAELESGENTKVNSARGFKRIYLLLDGREGSAPPLDNIKVREALNYAIDRDSIIENLLLGLAAPYSGYTHTGLPGQNADLSPYTYDPEKAKQMLAEAGYPNGFAVNLYTPVGSFPKDKEIAEAVAAQLGEVGVQVTLVPMEFTDYSTKLNAGELKGITLGRRTTNTGDASDGYRFSLWSKGVYNYSPNANFDALFEESETILDMPERQALFHDKIEPLIWTEMIPEVTLFDLVDTFGLSKRLDWAPVNPREVIDLRGITAVGE